MASKTELAKAYVEIIPSATGIGGKISEALGGEVTAAGATAGQSLGKSLIGAVGKILAAAGIGKMLQAAFTEGSAFETEVAKVGTIADTTKVPIGELKEQISDLSGTMGIAAGPPTRPSVPGRTQGMPWPLPGRRLSWPLRALPVVPRRSTF